ncbi:MAG: hypothetical protein WBW92_08760 [Rhodanobacteraceae bacterium]
MGTRFWILRFLTVLAGAFVIIGLAQMLRGHDLLYSVNQAAIWSIISASVFTVSRYVQARNNQHCAICKDTPEMQRPDRTGSS